MPDPAIQTTPLTSPVDGVQADPSPGGMAAIAGGGEGRTALEGTTPRSAMLIVFLVVFIDLLGFGIVLPLLPLFGDEYVSAVVPGGKSSAMGGAVIGLLMASFSAMQFFFAPGWGRLSDRIGRRPVLLIGLGGSVLFYSLFGYALLLPKETEAVLALVLMFVARIGAGVSGATISTAQAVIADCTPPDKRKHGMALIGAAFGIGFTFGPLVGASSLSLFPGQHWVIGAASATMSAVALVLGLILLPETRHKGGAIQGRRIIDFRAVRWALTNPAIAPVLWTFFLASLGFGGFEVTLALLSHDALGLDDAHIFWIFAFVGFVLVLAQGLLYRRLANRVSEPTFMAAGMLLMALGVATIGGVAWLGTQPDWYATAALIWLALPCMAVAVTGFALLTPSAQALISRRTHADRQGEILGVNQSASAMARILGPIIALTLYKATPTHLLPYAFGATLLLIMLLVIPRIRRHPEGA
jgi:DHA1 family tetracycline resistance protein-like MFS transporter